MRFKLYRQYGALNSQPIFDAFALGAQSLGHSIVDDHEDVAVIWSVLWSGRMSRNRQVYQQCRNIKKSVIIIEVGNLHRNHTWRISLNHINNLGEFANDRDLDSTRPKKLGVNLKDRGSDQRPDILIACQHSHSLQWEGMPPMKTWVENTVKQIRAKSQRKIIVRPHPRSLFGLDIPGVTLERPRLISGSYDDFDIFYNYHCVINHNSGPAVQAAIQGVPVLCDSTSLASNLSITWDQIETPMMPDRQEWFLRLCHTEWTVEEISQGMPLARLMSKIS
jgi:hypothetical protein